MKIKRTCIDKERYNFTKDKSLNRQKGEIAEIVASKYLIKKGYSIVEFNYYKKWGEIDIVARKAETIHFIEVKSTWRSPSVTGKGDLRSGFSGSLGSSDPSVYNLASSVHSRKRLRLSRVIQTYLSERGVGPETPITIDVALVELDSTKRVGKVELIENVIL